VVLEYEGLDDELFGVSELAVGGKGKIHRDLNLFVVVGGEGGGGGGREGKKTETEKS